MTHHTLNASVPQHLYGMVQTDILQGMDDSQGFEPCVIIGVTSIPSRCLHFSILCESGAQWARIPIHMLRWNEPEIAPHPITDLQCWDCHGWDFSTVQYEYLREMGCEYRKPVALASIRRSISVTTCCCSRTDPAKSPPCPTTVFFGKMTAL